MIANWHADDEAERDAARPATAGYTGESCPYCGRVRVYLRNDGQFECEKCERVWSLESRAAEIEQAKQDAIRQQMMRGVAR